MKNLLQLMGTLSRDMLFMQGHISSLQGLDGVAPKLTRAPAPDTAAKRTAALQAETGRCEACTC
jgi:hypothetical protein